jgi:hypothetical protein
MTSSKQRINEETFEAIRTYMLRHGDPLEIVPAEHNSGKSTFTRHILVSFDDGRVENHKILLEGNHITNEVKVLSGRTYEPITPEKILDGAVEVPSVGRKSQAKQLNDVQKWILEMDKES